MANQLAQLEKCGPVALAHIKQLILALEINMPITRTSYWPD